jgi:hypothetical protein
MGSFLPFGACPYCTHIKIFAKKKTCGRRKKTKKSIAQIGTNVRACVFNAGLLVKSQFSSGHGRSCDQPTRSRFSVVFFGPRANAELVPKFHVALHASHAVLSMVRLKILRYTTVPLGWPTLFMGDMDEGTLHEKERK